MDGDGIVYNCALAITFPSLCGWMDADTQHELLAAHVAPHDDSDSEANNPKRLQKRNEKGQVRCWDLARLATYCNDLKKNCNHLLLAV